MSDEVPRYRAEDIAEYADSSVAELAVESRTEDIAQSLARQFVEYVIDEAGQSIETGTFRLETVETARSRLYHEGFDPDPDPEDVADCPVSIFAPPPHHFDFRQDGAERSELLYFDEDPGIEYPPGTRVFSDPSIPSDRVIVVHHDAIAPTPTFSANRPWLVKHPEGVVVIEVSDSG